jgi:hypothetical protein
VKYLGLLLVAAGAAAATLVMNLLGWTGEGTRGLDLVLWALFFLILVQLYWGFPKPAVARRLPGTAGILVLALVATFVVKALSVPIMGGSVEVYPFMSLAFACWSIWFLLVFVWADV